jgi:hypothetical protein
MKQKDILKKIHIQYIMSYILIQINEGLQSWSH